jgi:hypothetical protein
LFGCRGHLQAEPRVQRPAASAAAAAWDLICWTWGIWSDLACVIPGKWCAKRQSLSLRAFATQQPNLHLREPRFTTLQLANQHGGEESPSPSGRTQKLSISWKLSAATIVRIQRVGGCGDSGLRRSDIRCFPQPGSSTSRNSILRKNCTFVCESRMGTREHAPETQHGWVVALAGSQCLHRQRSC